MKKKPKKYVLAKYPYGLVVHYTAFCVTPLGKRRGNAGVHFERPWSALEWVLREGVLVENPDFTLLPGTVSRGHCVNP